jgi:peptidoglycan/xylan/chitin deacetylase (PgdA/CDA1 family)
MTPHRSRSAPLLASRRRVLTGLLMAALGVASGFTTASISAARSHPGAVAYATDVALSAQTPSAPAYPYASAPPRPASLVSTGVCLNVPILVYHYIRVVTNPNDHVGWGLSVTPPEFAEQMDWLRQAGGHPVTLAQVLSALDGGPALPAHAVVLTFDDGYADFATAALPVLLRNAFVATDYVVSGFLGRSSYMTIAQVLQADHDGMVIGAHTVHHVDLVALSASAAASEIAVSRATLQQVLGHAVRDFAYPYGDVNAAVAGMVAAAGFADAVTMNAGTQQCGSGRFLLHRTRVGGGDTVWSFAAKAGVAGPPAGWTDHPVL